VAGAQMSADGVFLVPVDVGNGQDRLMDPRLQISGLGSGKEACVRLPRWSLAARVAELFAARSRRRPGRRCPRLAGLDELSAFTGFRAWLVSASLSCPPRRSPVSASSSCPRCWSRRLAGLSASP
jgi:hypothetical protein